MKIWEVLVESDRRERQNSLGYLRATHYSLENNREKCLPEDILRRLCSGLHALDDGNHPKFIVRPIRFYNSAATT